MPELAPAARLEDAAFWPLASLGTLLRTRQVSAAELTRMYLDRLKRHNPQLRGDTTREQFVTFRKARDATLQPPRLIFQQGDNLARDCRRVAKRHQHAAAVGE